MHIPTWLCKPQNMKHHMFGVLSQTQQWNKSLGYGYANVSDDEVWT